MSSQETERYLAGSTSAVGIVLLLISSTVETVSALPLRPEAEDSGPSPAPKGAKTTKISTGAMAGLIAAIVFVVICVPIIYWLCVCCRARKAVKTLKAVADSSNSVQTVIGKMKRYSNGGESA